MNSRGEGKLVCVTGGSGYIASWLVKLLLQHGYTVNATVRDPNDPKKTQHLYALEGAKERLHLFKADLVDEESFDMAVNGCQGVFHTASPVNFFPTNPQDELIEPAVKGAINVLKSCKKVNSIKRVVMTASLASVIFNGKPLTSDMIIDETWFSDPAFCQQHNYWYMLAKTLAEEAARKFAEENGIDLVILNPGFSIGPFLQPNLHMNTQEILHLINGTRGLPMTNYRLVDIRDVAFAHIQALEVPTASGRYCIVGKVLHFTQVLEILRGLFPALRLPEKCDYGKPYEPTVQVSKEKAKTLDITFTPVEVSLKDTIECLKEKGYLSF